MPAAPENDNDIWLLSEVRCVGERHEVESGKIEGYVPTIVLNELLHRLMIAEVIERGYAVNTLDAI